jgi:prepilin peptidase CpaA
MDVELMRVLAVAGVTCAASAYDVRSRTIPNRVTGAGFAVGLSLAALAGGTAVVLHLGTAAVMLLATLPLFAAGALGGGDVKLLVCVGALVGPGPLPAALALTALAGGTMALVEAVRRGVLLPLVFEARDAMAHYATLGRRVRPGRSAAAATLSVPYGPAIGIGAVAACLL